jgi:hypothetical protein
VVGLPKFFNSEDVRYVYRMIEAIMVAIFEPVVRQIPAFTSWQDLVLAIGTFVGWATKVIALWDENTTWTRKSTIINLAFYPTSLAAFWTLDLFVTFTVMSMNAITWLGIYLWRSPAREDWLGRE